MTLFPLMNIRDFRSNDYILTNIPDKVVTVQGFDDNLNTDHRLITFDTNFNIAKKPMHVMS